MAITALTAFLPFITSGSIFAPRRMEKGLSSDNVLVSIMDYDVAVGQGAKVVEGAANIAKESSNSKLVASVIKKEKALEEFLKADKAVEALGKATRFTMNNINPLIGATEIVKAISADNKEEAALTGGLAFGSMLVGEKAAKHALGLSDNKYENGKYKITPREALYKKMPGYSEKSAEAIKDFCATKTLFGKHVFKHAPTIAKGGLFAATSIGFFKLGDKAGEIIYEKLSETKEEGSQKAKYAELKTTENSDKDTDKDCKQAA